MKYHDKERRNHLGYMLNQKEVSVQVEEFEPSNSHEFEFKKYSSIFRVSLRSEKSESSPTIFKESKTYSKQQ